MDDSMKVEMKDFMRYPRCIREEYSMLLWPGNLLEWWHENYLVRSGTTSEKYHIDYY